MLAVSLTLLLTSLTFSILLTSLTFLFALLQPLFLCLFVFLLIIPCLPTSPLTFDVIFGLPSVLLFLPLCILLSRRVIAHLAVPLSITILMKGVNVIEIEVDLPWRRMEICL